MTETERPLTPNETLAATVADALVTAGLVPVSNRKDLLEKLNRGTARQEDWLGWIEAGMPSTPPEAAE